MLRADHIRRLVRAAGVAVVAAVLALLLLDRGVCVDLVMKAAGIPSNASGLGGFVNGAHALVTPALVMAAPIAPLTLVVGGVVLMLGGRRGMQIVGTSLGVLLLLGSVTAPPARRTVHRRAPPIRSRHHARDLSGSARGLTVVSSTGRVGARP